MRPLTHKLIPLAALACLGAARAEPEQLPTVLVSATRHAMSLVDAPAAVSVVSAEQIEARGADNLLEALRGETGVSVFGRTISGRKTLSLRGMDARHTLVLVNGKRIGASDGVIGHSDFQIDWVAADEIERVEVVRGPLSVLYGAEALGGVVNIITRQPGDQWQGSARLEGSWADGGRGGDGHRASLRLGGPLVEGAQGVKAALTLADTRRDAVASGLDPRISDIEGRHKQDASLTLQWQMAPQHQLELEGRVGREQRDALAVERSGKKRVYASDTLLERQHLMLGWEADWDAARQWHSAARVYSSRIAMSNERNNGVAALRPNTLSDQVLEAQLNGRVTEAHWLTTGLEWREEGLRNEGLPGGDAQARHASVFLQDEWRLQPALTLTAGLRRDQHQRFGGVWSPRVYGVWHLARAWTLKGGYSEGFKPPTLKQITPGYQEDEGPYTYQSNPALRPEKNRALELGLGFDERDVGAQLMLFDNRVRDLIVPLLISSNGPRSLFRFDNIDRARLRGVEASARWRLAGGFSLAANYQYLDARDGTGQRLEKRPRYTLGAGLDWADGPWHAGLRLDRSSAQLLASTLPGQPLQPVPAITMLGANAGRSLGANLTLDLGVSNLGNTQLSERSPLFTWAEAPRTWRLSLRGQW
jgi:outer membrane receptor for ferrienterochelin and colicins